MHVHMERERERDEIVGTFKCMHVGMDRMGHQPWLLLWNRGESPPYPNASIWHNMSPLLQKFNALHNTLTHHLPHLSAHYFKLFGGMSTSSQFWLSLQIFLFTYGFFEVSCFLNSFLFFSNFWLIFLDSLLLFRGLSEIIFNCQFLILEKLFFLKNSHLG